MADQEEQAAAVAETPAQPQANAVETEEPATAQPRRFVKRLPKPDNSEHQAKVAKLQAEIDSNKARLEEIKAQLESRAAQRRGQGSGEGAQLRSQLADLRTQFSNELARKQRIRQELEAASKARDGLRAQLRQMKERMQYLTVEKIDEQVAWLEERMSHTSMSLNEEKRCLEDIKRLRASRTAVAQYNERMEQLSSDDNLRSQIVERLKASDTKLNEIKGREEGVRGALAALKEREAASSADVPAILQEREERRAIVDAAYTALKALRAEWRGTMDAWHANELEWRKQRDEERKRKNDEYEKEREARAAERKAREAELAGDPFYQEVGMAEQLMAYLEKFVAKEDTAVEAAAKVVEAPTGMVAVKRKGEEEEVFYGGGKGAKGKGKGKSRARAEDKPENRKLTHSLDVLGSFAKLKITVPHTSGEVPAAVAAVQARKEYYLARREAVRAGTDTGAPEPAENGTATEPGEAAGSSSDVAAAGTASLADAKENDQASANGSLGPAAAKVGPLPQWGPNSGGSKGWASAPAPPAPATAGQPAVTHGDSVAVDLAVEGGEVAVSLTVTEDAEVA